MNGIISAAMIIMLIVFSSLSFWISDGNHLFLQPPVNSEELLLREELDDISESDADNLGWFTFLSLLLGHIMVIIRKAFRKKEASEIERTLGQFY